jgi:hypothetical protein
VAVFRKDWASWRRRRRFTLATAGTAPLPGALELSGAAASSTWIVPVGTLTGTGAVALSGATAARTSTVPLGTLTGASAVALAGGAAAAATSTVPLGTLTPVSAPLSGSSASSSWTVTAGALVGAGSAALAGSSPSSGWTVPPRHPDRRWGRAALAGSSPSSSWSVPAAALGATTRRAQHGRHAHPQLDRGRGRPRQRGWRYPGGHWKRGLLELDRSRGRAGRERQRRAEWQRRGSDIHDAYRHLSALKRRCAAGRSRGQRKLDGSDGDAKWERKCRAQRQQRLARVGHDARDAHGHDRGDRRQQSLARMDGSNGHAGRQRRGCAQRGERPPRMECRRWSAAWQRNSDTHRRECSRQRLDRRERRPPQLQRLQPLSLGASPWGAARGLRIGGRPVDRGSCSCHGCAGAPRDIPAALGRRRLPAWGASRS